MGRGVLNEAVKRQRLVIGSRLKDVRYAMTDAPPSRVASMGLFCFRLGTNERSWYNYEGGAAMPTELVLSVITLLGVCPHWLRTGEGMMFTAMREGAA